MEQFFNQSTTSYIYYKIGVIMFVCQVGVDKSLLGVTCHEVDFKNIMLNRACVYQHSDATLGPGYSKMSGRLML